MYVSYTYSKYSLAPFFLFYFWSSLSSAGKIDTYDHHITQLMSNRHTVTVNCNRYIPNQSESCKATKIIAVKKILSGC